MPFPLAHPAAVLPLRRFCPRFLSFPALVAGSLSPDAGYIFGETGVSDIAHSFVGGMGFGLIVGLLMLGVYYALGTFVLPRVRDRFRRALLPLFQEPLGSAGAIVVSIVIGVWTHLLLDSFTHTHGWLVQHLEVLQTPLLAVFGRQIKLCHVLWYACSFAGVALLVLAFRAWQEPPSNNSSVLACRSRLLEAFLVAALVLPIEILHHVVRTKVGVALVALLSLMLTVAVVAKLIMRVRA